MTRLLARATRARWNRASGHVYGIRYSLLRNRMAEARYLRDILATFLSAAEDRAALPRIGSDVALHPDDADWNWRPGVFRWALPKTGISGVASGTRLGGAVSIFHDCTLRDLSLRQIRNRTESDLAPYGLALDVFGFSGSFASFVFDLPRDALDGLRRRHIIRLDALIETETPCTFSARLNVQHGPNCEQVFSHVDFDFVEASAEFDLGYSELNERRVEKAWVDLIVEMPEMNRIVVRDVGFSRSLRSEI